MGRSRREIEVPTWAKAQAAATRLWNRRQGEEGLPDPGDFLALAQHVWRHPLRDSERQLEDAADVITMLDYVEAHTDRVRLGVLEATRKSGVTLAALAPILGFRQDSNDPHGVRTSVLSFLRRLELGVKGLPKDESAYRRQRALEQLKVDRKEAERAWLARAETENAVRTVAQVLIDRAGSLPEHVADMVEDLAADLEECTRPGSVDGLVFSQLRVTLRLVATAAHTGEAVQDQTLHAALTRGRELLEIHQRRFAVPEKLPARRRRRRRTTSRGRSGSSA
ncbi:hypothetical protein SUDANB95_07890 (plasmid) [Actinosynnema sp. ALI-1.44]